MVRPRKHDYPGTAPQGGDVKALKIIRTPWTQRRELQPWRPGYDLPWAAWRPWWPEFYWMTPFCVRDMTFVPDLWIRRLCGEWP